MKFIHIADVHLGANPDAGSAYTKSRAREIWDSLEKVIQICEKEKTDLLLIAGDLFHRQPLLRELKEVKELFARLSVTKVVLIVGNHDYLKKDSYYRTFVWTENVSLILSTELCAVCFPELGTAVYGCSYDTRERTDVKLKEMQAEHRQPIEILLFHGGDDKHLPFRREELTNLGYAYAALGHIHKPGQLLANRAAYAGALEPIDQNDTGEHGYIAGEITEEGCKIRFVPLAGRKYCHIELPVDKGMTGYALKEAWRQTAEEKGIENIYKLTLTGYRDPEVVFDLSGIDLYGNITEIRDETKPAYDFGKLRTQNQGNILGKLIEELEGYPQDTTEYQALCEGVRALMETRKG